MQLIEIILLCVVLSSVIMVLYFNHLTAQQKKEIKNITAANRSRVNSLIKNKIEKLSEAELAEAI